LGAGASSHHAARMRAHAHSKGYPFARSVTPSPRMTCNISTCAKRTACSRTAWRWNYCCHSMTHDQLAHTERICEQWMHAGVRAASDEKGNIHSNNENNQNKWCADCGCVESCLGMRVHGSASEWHGSHGYSGGSVAHDMRMRTHVRACLCGIVGTYLCCHGLRCGSSSRRSGHGRLESHSFSASPCRRLRRILCCVHLYQLRVVGKYAMDNMPSSGARASVTISHSARTI